MLNSLKFLNLGLEKYLLCFEALRFRLAYFIFLLILFSPVRIINRLVLTCRAIHIICAGALFGISFSHVPPFHSEVPVPKVLLNYYLMPFLLPSILKKPDFNQFILQLLRPIFCKKPAALAASLPVVALTI